MEQYKMKLEARFGCFPEPALYFSGGQVLYANEPGEQLLRREDFPLEFLLALAEHPGGAMEIARGDDIFRITVSRFDDGDLLILRPLDAPAEETHPFSNAVFRMRECLSSLFSVQERLRSELEERELTEDFLRVLSDQNRLSCQMLRLTRQAELTQELDDRSFPREEGFDLAMVCRGMADETAMLADLAGVRFTYVSNTEHLPFKASKSLLTQMLLALVSNGIRAAGREGEVEMKLRAEGGRVVISVKDSGVGFPEDRMATLFSGRTPEDIPRPGEGAGLGLYNARRIAALHGGVVVAQSDREGGTALVVSLPVVTPESVPERNNPGYDNLGGFSPVRIELSDVLPWQAYVPGAEKRQDP